MADISKITPLGSSTTYDIIARALNYAPQITTLEELNAFGKNEIKFKVAKISALDGHTGTLTKNDGMILAFPWSGGYGHQFYIDDNGYGLHHRYWYTHKVNDVDTVDFNNWVQILDSSNYTNYTVKKDGTGATGTWGISITGNSATSTKTGVASMWTYSENNNELNFGGTNNSSTIYFGYRAKDSKPIPTKFIFGNSTGTADLQAKTVYLGSGTSSYISSTNYTGNAATATKATNDSDGNAINTTYLKLSGGTMTGNINRTYTADSAEPLITASTSNHDIYLWHVGHSDANGSKILNNACYKLFYKGTNSSPNNYLQLLCCYGGTDTWAVQFDESGNIKCNKTVAASITGNAATATQLATARSINGTNFNGTANITTANWGTARTITIGSTGKSVNGSSDISWSKAEILGSSSSGYFYRGDQTWSDTINGNTLKITNNSNTLEIGSNNTSWAHFTNSANIPFYFNHQINAVDGFKVYNTTTSLTNNNLTFSQGGGWSMSDSTWIRTVGGKSVYMNTGTFRNDGTTQLRTLQHVNANIATDGSWTTGTTGTANSDDNSATQGAQGTSILTIGNNIARPAAGTTGGANNSQGYLRLHSSGTGYGELTGYTTSANTHIHATNGFSAPENRIGFMFRPGSRSYYTHISYETSGNEALVAATQNAVTSFIFVNGESYANVAADRWTKLTGASGAGNAPGLQIKQNCVSIGELIPSGTNATYKLNVNGTQRIKSGSLQIYPTGGNYNDGIRIHARSTDNTWAAITLCGADNTGDTGISANSWFLGNNGGNLYITRNGSSNGTAMLACVNNVWQWNGTATGSISGNAGTATRANITTTTNAIAYYTNTSGTFGSKASANGALYATSANGALTFGTLPVAQGGTGQTTVANIKAGKDADGNTISSTYIKNSIGTTKGDIIYWSAGSTPARLGIGSNGKVLKVVSGVPAWGDVSIPYGETLPSTGTNGDVFLQTSAEYYELPAGGTTGQVLAKSSNADRAVQWVNSINISPSSAKFYPAGSTVATTNSNPQVFNTAIYVENNVLFGAAWNDYAEFRKDNPIEKQEPGRCVRELGDGTLALTTQRLERGCEIISDTFGFAIGQDEENGYNTPIASNGRVLAYPYESIDEFKNYIGWPVCSGPNGTVSIMTEEEEEKYPSRIIGIISEIPTYKEWGASKVQVNGRIWIRIK